MATPHKHITDYIDASGIVNASAKNQLRTLVTRYPYYHAARMTLLRLLYQQRDPEFNEELRRAALFLPSRETIYEMAEGDKLKPKPAVEDEVTQGATHLHKPNTRLSADSGEGEQESRTATLIDNFLETLPDSAEDTVSKSAPSRRRPRAADASVDYISWMLQEEERQSKLRQQATEVAAQAGGLAGECAGAAETRQTGNKVGRTASNNNTDAIIEDFIQNKGDGRIRLNDKRDSELQKPVIDEESNSQHGAFTETLARIYIKQRKFEQAIVIIRRLSLKYPKKNRYFADQIRFLEKLLVNQKAAE